MGGAQAGEVASEIAVEAFAPGCPTARAEDGLADDHPGGQRARSTTRRARDEQHAGMGTTCTAAYVAEDEVVDRPRRRLARLPAARRRADPAHRATTRWSASWSTAASSPRRRRGRTRSARSSPARSGPEPDGRGRHRAHRGARRRRLPALLRRADGDGPRAGARRSCAARDDARGRRPQPDRRRQRGRRARQHHGHPVPPRGGRRRGTPARGTADAPTVERRRRVPDFTARPRRATAAARARPSRGRAGRRSEAAGAAPTAADCRARAPRAGPRPAAHRAARPSPPSGRERPPPLRADARSSRRVARRRSPVIVVVAILASWSALARAPARSSSSAPTTARPRDDLPRPALRPAVRHRALHAQLHARRPARRRSPEARRETFTDHKLRSLDDADDLVDAARERAAGSSE